MVLIRKLNNPHGGCCTLWIALDVGNEISFLTGRGVYSITVIASRNLQVSGPLRLNAMFLVTFPGVSKSRVVFYPYGFKNYKELIP